MSHWQWVALILVVLFFAYGWYHDHQLMPKRQAKQMAEAEERRTSEEYVFQQQMKFEKELQEGAEIGLPDAVTRRSAYIYRYLMREWFSKLAAQGRYDEPKLRKVRKDWLVYMEALRSNSMSNFLSAESDDEAKREKYGREAWEDKMQLTAIEDAFAAAVGPEAVATLGEIRAKDALSFSSAGELAPDGYWYAGYNPHGGAEEPLPRRAS